jgi:hypothetical protein
MVSPDLASHVDDLLAQSSSFTYPQVETLILQMRVLRGELSTKEAAKIRRNGEGVTLGAYYRVVNQARDNAIAAIFTLLLSLRIGIIKLDELRRLLDLVSRLPPEIDDVSSNQVMSLVDAVVEKLVMT